jgi:hypothetical protein
MIGKIFLAIFAVTVIVFSAAISASQMSTTPKLVG